MRKLPKRHKGKAKRWPKGQSSNSNPETKKFREAAKSRFFRHESSKKSSLTVGALKALDAFNNRSVKPGNESDNDNFSDATTFDSWASAKTFKTFASDWSSCSNMSFNRLLKKFEPTSALHKEMLAVLAAVTEVIKGNGGKETNTEYFGAMMTALGACENEEAVTATLSLLAMCIKAVPQEVLRLKFSEASDIFLHLMSKYCENENSVIMRSVIGCLSVLLRAQDPGVWSDSSTVNIFHSILVFTTHSKPKIRKAAQHAVCAVLKASSMFAADDTHPGAIDAAKYCIQQIEKGESFGGGTTTLHVLSLLKDIIVTFPKNYIKSACETILKLMTLGTALTTTCSLEVFHGLFVSDAASINRLTASLNAKILNALYDYQPSSSDYRATLAWLTVMQEAHKSLARRDPQLCLDNLTKFYVVASNLWLSENAEIAKASTLTLRIVATDCLSACRECRNFDQVSRKVFNVVENGLKYQYNKAWNHVLGLLGVLFEVIGKGGESYMMASLKSLAGLRESHNFLYLTELEHAIGKAIRFLGPEIVLKAVPVVVTGNETDYEFRTSWLLPALRENIRSSSLKFFIDQFLPLAMICERKRTELNAKNDKIGAHVYELLQLQIWWILPSVCGHAEDAADNFKVIAKPLGMLISDRKQLRIPAMSALRKLVARSRERGDEASLRELARYAKNYLPILFTLYTGKASGTDEGGERLAAFDTIKVYLSVASEDVCAELFDKAVKRVEEAAATTAAAEAAGEKTSDDHAKESVMDLLKLLVPFQTLDRLTFIYDKCMSAIREGRGSKDEKKAYRLLEVVMSSESRDCKTLMRDKTDEFLSFALTSLKGNNVGHRGARLRCILRLMPHIPEKRFDALREILPEAITCCRDINRRTRSIAFKLIEEILVASKKWSEKDDADVLRDYVNLIVGGLAGTPSLASATVLVLAKLTSSLRSELPSDVVQLVLDSVCLLCGLAAREIVGSCLVYLKVFTTAFAKDVLFSHVPAIMKALVSMKDDCKNHFRLKSRDVLDRLLRKFGYDTIKLLVPEDDVIMQKRLKNLRKVNAKKQSGKSATDDCETAMEDFVARAKAKSIEEILASSDDDEEEEEEDKAASRKKGKATKETYIEEDPDNIIDLLAPTASGKLTATKPIAKRRKEKKERDAKVASDGRLIVVDDSGERESVGDEDSDLEDVRSMMSEVAIGRKRKLSASADSAYKAGGSGIHRAIKSARLETKRDKARGRRRRNAIRSLKTGKEYRAKKAGGDVRLKGKLDPYAYIPLSRKLLNRRKRQKRNAQFDSVVKSALKGARKGIKAKSRRTRRERPSPN